MSKTVTYVCEKCSKKCTAMRGSVLVTLQLCQECQDKRFAAGIEAQRRAEAAEARRG